MDRIAIFDTTLRDGEQAPGFSMNVDAVSDAESHETQEFLADVAREREVYVAGGVVGRGSNGRGLNECVVYDPNGEEVARYAKMQRAGTIR